MDGPPSKRPKLGTPDTPTENAGIIFLPKFVCFKIFKLEKVQ